MSGVIASLIVELKTDMSELVSASKDSREHLKNIEGHAKSLEGALGSLKEFAMDAGKALVGAFTVERIVEGMKAGIEATIAYGKELRDLSEETRINVVSLQALTSETSDYGIDAQRTANLVFQLSQRVAGGDASAATAFGKLGISIEDLKAKSPDQMFITTVGAVNSIESPLLRAGAAADLFGAKAGAAVQRLPKDFGEAVARNKELNVAMGEDAVNATAKWEASVDKLENSMKAFAGNTLGPLLEKMAKYATTTNDIFNAQGNAPKPEPFGGLTIDQNKKNVDEMGPGGTSFSFGGKPIDATSALFGEQAANNLRAIREQLKPLTEEQERYLEQLYDMGRLTLQDAQAYNVTAGQMAAFKTKEQEIIETQRLNAETLKAQKKAYDDLNIAGAKAENELSALAMKRLEVLTHAHQEILNMGRDAQASLNDRGLGGPANQSPFDQALAARDRGYKDIQINKDLLTTAKGGITTDEMLAFQSMAAKVEADFDAASTAVRSGGENVKQGLDGAGGAAKAFADGVNTIAIGMAGYKQKGQEGWFGWSPNGAGDTFVNPTSPWFSPTAPAGTGTYTPPPRRAFGGAVQAGQPYWVGDGGGPELFIPSASGSIAPSGGGMSGGSVNVSVSVAGSIVSERELVAVVKKALEKDARLQRKLPAN